MEETKNCNCTFSGSVDNITLELGCCDKNISLNDAMENGKCVECDKPIMVFDCIEDAEEYGE